MADKPVQSVVKQVSFDRRQWQRVLVDLEVDYGNRKNYLFAYIRDISVTGIFIRTHTPEPPGTQLNLRFTPRGARQPLELEGEVIWVNPFRPGDPDNLDPGMGIRFDTCDAMQRRRLEQIVTTLALLCDPEPPTESETR